MFTYNKILPNFLDLASLSMIPFICLITFLSGSGGLLFPNQSGLIATHSIAAIAVILAVATVADLGLAKMNGTVGSRWHQIWHPIIIVACTALTPPVLNGHCLAEPIVNFLIGLLA